MKRLFYLLLLPAFLYSCSGSPEGFRDFKTDDPSAWNISGKVEQTKDELTLTGNDARAITTTSYHNFILELECKTAAGAIGGIYFHSNGYCGLKTGYEVLINNDEDASEWRKTGSLTAVRNFGKCVAYNDEWTPIRIEVSGMNIKVYVNEHWVIDYYQPQNPFRLPDYSQRILSRGVFVFANHSGAPIAFRNIRVKTLEEGPLNIANAMDEETDELIRLHQQNFPLIDTRLHLKEGLTAEDVEVLTRKYGITYGVLSYGGPDRPIHSDQQAYDRLNEMKGRLFLLPMQAEGTDWVSLFSEEAVRSFDYIIADASYTEERIADKEKFVDNLVNHACAIIETGQVNIVANATLLPQELQAEYNQLWTQERMERIIDACVHNHVAIEINCRLRIPAQPFIMLAKEKGAKFAIGTDNESLEDIGQPAYAIEMIKACELASDNMFIPTSKNR